MTTDWLKAAQRTTDPYTRTRFLRNHKADQIKGAIAGCELCPLSLTRINTVPFDNNKSRPVVLIGEAPGASEDKQGRPFVGRSGKLLDKIIAIAGRVGDGNALTRDDVVVMNTIACRPPDNRNPYQSEISSCSNHFTAQLNFTGAWIVVMLGAQALKACGFGGRISEVRGIPMWREGRLWIPTYHPAYVLRNPKAQKDVVKDIGLALKIGYGGEWWEPVKMDQFGDGELKGLVGFLDTRGWVVVDSRRLEDRVVVVRDENVNVPKKYEKLIQYTLEELVRIGEVGKGHRVSLADLKGIHLVKGLGGMIVK